MRILVTGADGFVGSELMRNSDPEFQLYGLSRRAIPQFASAFRMRELNIDFLTNLLSDNSFDGIIHLATKFSVNHKSEDVPQIIDSNITLGAYLCEAAISTNRPWILNIGSVWQHFSDEGYAPVNLYSASKQAFQDLLLHYISNEGLHGTTLNLADIYSPRDTRPKLLNIIRTALPGQTIELTKGTNFINILHSDEVVGSAPSLVDTFVFFS